MKHTFLILISLFVITGCSTTNDPNGETDASQIDFEFTGMSLGGADIHGELYRKKYPGEEDAVIQYNQWPGYLVNSNEELELLYKTHPDCKAIKFDYWKQQGEDSSYFALSEVIGKFSNLKYLEITSNRINEYPISITELTDLEELIIQLREKKSIEFDFSNFTKLRHLTIHHADDLETFPFSIFELKNLESLKLFRFFSVSENELNGIDNLSKLKELYIWDSDLNLPENFGSNLKLKTLILDRYRKVIPRGVFEMESLERLALSTMFDTIDFEDISKLKKLEALSLTYQGCFLNKMDLPNLEHLDITSYEGSNLNIGISALRRLKSLVIWDCGKIEKLEGFSASTLQSIVINANDALTEIVFDEAKLNNIEEVITKYNDQLKLEATTVGKVTIQTN